MTVQTPPSGPPAPAASELPKQYRPADHESRIRSRWESSGAFHADPNRVRPDRSNVFSIVIPPPNVTDRLHLGHALNNTLQDVLVRAHRMMGFETLWMPGTDHAGIATQAVVERRLRKEGKLKGSLKDAMAREDFVAIVQSFKDEYEATIVDQLKKMGCSCDWERLRFTMDDVCARAVREAFFRLFKDGLIYRGKRLVNWDPALQTAVADDECYDEEIDGQFYYLRYPLVHPHGASTQRERQRGELPPRDAVPVTWSELESRGYPGAENHSDEEQAFVTVATTRPETYLGDTAVAVNPLDPRAKALRGLCAELPLVGRIIPIIEDLYVVLPSAESPWAKGLALPDIAEGQTEDPKAAFATGFLKVTPAHDPNDYELYHRHKEAMDTFQEGQGKALINIFAPDATISDKHGWADVRDAHIFVGKKRDEARKLAVEEFKARTVANGTTPLLAETRPYRHSVKHSDRSKAIIEPYLSDQWYVKVTDPRLAAAANRALVADQRTHGGTALQSGGSANARGNPPEAVPIDLVPIDSIPDQPIRPAGFVARDPYPPGQWSPDDLIGFARNLPHLELPEATYFVTWRAESGFLTDAERTLVLDSLKHGDGVDHLLYAATVMPDHLHVILKPLTSVGVGPFVASVKKFTARRINAGRKTEGHFWQDERFDHIVRDGGWFTKFLRYIANNPVEAGLAARPSEYPWTFVGAEVMRALEGRRQVEVGRSTTALESGATMSSAIAGDGALRFYPSRYAKTYEQWHDNIRDWCISRQLWWGHRIPVWHKRVALTEKNWVEEVCGEAGLDSYIENNSPDHCVRFVRSESGTIVDLRKHLMPVVADTAGAYDIFICCKSDEGSELAQYGYSQDPDVLDTWFSSALWPMSTMGWPDPQTAGPEFKGLLEAFNPTSTLCTAREIITLWVSRMVMFNRYFMPERALGTGHWALGEEAQGRGNGVLPFKDVFIHAMIQDGDGRKMSKSLGNGVDPLDIIASHGADAMRFTLCQMTTQTQDVRMPVEKDSATGKNTSRKFDIGRNFSNKMWNAARFAMGILEGQRTAHSSQHTAGAGGLSLVDRWMLSRLRAGVEACTGALKAYEYSDYAQSLYRLVWDDFCDWYLESIKPTVAADRQQQAVLKNTLDALVRLAHPAMPFITEAIFERLGSIDCGQAPFLTLHPPRRGDMLCTAGWPEVSPEARDDAADAHFARLQSLVSTIREVRAQHQVNPKRRIVLHAPQAIIDAIAPVSAAVHTLGGLERATTEKPAGSSVAFRFESGELHVSDLADAMDAGAESARLQKQATDLEKSIATLTARLANPGYSERAPAAMVQQTRDQLAKAQADLAAVQESSKRLGG